MWTLSPLAREAGLPKATDVVVGGAASHFLPLAPETLESHIGDAFTAKGARVVEANLRAFRAGRHSVTCTPS